MPMNKHANGVVATLADAAPEAQVSVLVRPAGHGLTGPAGTVDPRQFSSASAYRSALIAQQKAGSRPLKEALVHEAHSLGLDAHVAGTLNAVVVHGSAGNVLRLLDQVQYESVNFDTALTGTSTA